MAVLEKIKQMQTQNMNDSQIYQSLSEQGFNPKDISDGLSQARIRNAVMNQSPGEDKFANPQQMPPMGMRQYPGSSRPSAVPNSYQQLQDASQMQDYSGYETSLDPALTDLNPEFANPQQMQQSSFQNAQMPQPQMSQEEYQMYNQMPQNYQPAEQYGYDQNYSQPQSPEYGYDQNQQEYQDAGYYQEGITLETVNDVAEQVFIEKTKKIRSDLDSLNEFKIMLQSQIGRIEKDINRIQSIIDNLQMSVIQKVGSYEQNINSIKNEMGMMQDSFGKVINQVANRNSSNQQQTQKSSPSIPKPAYLPQSTPGISSPQRETKPSALRRVSSRQK